MRIWNRDKLAARKYVFPSKYKMSVSGTATVSSGTNLLNNLLFKKNFKTQCRFGMAQTISASITGTSHCREYLRGRWKPNK
jgi:hypothetical protein